MFFGFLLCARRFFVIGNWKANPKTKSEALSIIECLNAATVDSSLEVVVASPSIFLPTLHKKLRPDWAVCAENVYTKDSGAFTGEITPPMLKDFGVTWVLLGSSERRDLLGETDDFLTEKITASLAAGLKIVYCCGEHLIERENANAIQFVTAQIEKIIPVIPAEKWPDIVIAYEPIWAIGSAKVASPEDAQAMIKAIREKVADKAGNEIADTLRILYGGSVRPTTAGKLAAQPDVDGFLVGRAALTPEFIEILNEAAIVNAQPEKAL